MDRGTHCRGGVLPSRLPRVEGSRTTTDDGGTWSNQFLASEKQNPQEGEEGHLCGKGPCQGEGSPPEGPGYHGHPGGRNRVAELVHHQGLVRGPCPLQKLGLLQMQILDRTGGTTWCGQSRAMPLTLNITHPGGVQHLKKMRLSWIST